MFSSAKTVFAAKNRLCGIDIDCSDIPDMVPAIAVTAAFAQGKTVIRGAERLRFKESNRLAAVVSNLRLMGVDALETADGMIITPSGNVHGASLMGYNDHRIVMAFSVAAMFAAADTAISDAESINKSYPSFLMITTAWEEKHLSSITGEKSSFPCLAKATVRQSAALLTGSPQALSLICRK